MKVICFMNIKGGVGKTASVTTLGHILATACQKRVLLVDLDPQSNTTAMFCSDNGVDKAKEFEMRFKNALEGNFFTIENSMATLLLNKNMDIHLCIQKTKYENLDIIPADLSMSAIETTLKSDISTPQQFNLMNHLRRIENEYDFCLIDCSPSVSLVNVNGLAAADEVYIPIRPDANSIMGLAFAINLIKTVSTYNPQLKAEGCYFIGWENYNCPQLVYDILNKYLPDLLLPIKINKSIRLAENTILSEPLYEMDNGKGMSKATRAYLQLAGYIISDNKEEYLKKIEGIKDITTLDEQALLTGDVK